VPIYQLGIHNGGHFEVPEVIRLPDDRTAREHAIWIVHELQKADEASWRAYTMEVKRDGRVIWRIPFEVSWPPADS
jgi:hypothetical protein